MTGNDLIKQILDKNLGDKEILITGTSDNGAVALENPAAIDEVTKEINDNDEEYGTLIINKELTD